MKQKLQTLLFALVAIMMPIGASAYYADRDPVVITIGGSGVATLYYSSSSLEIPDGVTASIITGIEMNNDGTVTVFEQDLDGVIPAGCAVILRGDEGEYSFEPIDDNPSLDNNLLQGTDETTTVAEEGYLYFTLDSENGENIAYLKDWIYAGSEFINDAHKAYLELSEDDYPELAAMLETLENPHLQHTHGGCEICDQNTGVIVINMSDIGVDGWNGASITVKKDGEELDETVTIEDGTEATVTLVYDLDSRYTFYWNMGEYDYECSFEIIVNGETVYIGSGGDFSDDIEFFFALGDPFVVSFNANDGSGSMDDIDTYESVTLPECTFTAPEGMMFDGWQVGDDEENLYQPGEEITVTADTEIKAVWTEFVPQIVINMSDSYVDGWNGASITVKKDGEELDETVTIEDGTEATVTLVYDLDSRYTFYWNMGECDYECSFEIIVNGENVFEALQHESESGTVSDCEDFTTEEPFFTLEATAIAEAKWGTSADALTEEGTLAEAFAATYTYGDGNETYISSEVRYIQLLSDVTSESGYVVCGGTFTLDLNGKTLQTDSHTLEMRGGEVTITDESSDKSGKVITTGSGAIAVYINEGSPKITIEGGQYKSNNQSAVYIESESCEVTINGGEFTTTESATQLITNHGTLTINGGTFDTQNAQYAIYVEGNTTISDGTFVEAQTADVMYCGGTLTFEATEATDETPGFSPMGLSVDYQAEDGVVADMILPEGYGFYNSDDEAVTDFQYDLKCYIGKEEGVGYTVTFSANYDTEETMDDAIVTSPTGKYALPECDFTAPEGMMFDAWQVGDDEENLYQPGDVITITADTEVTAVWGDIKIVINMSDSYGDGWHGAYIEVLKDGESIGRATLENGYDDGCATFDYDSNCTYRFIWHYGPGINYLNEISFEISIGEEQLFTSEEGDCEEYADGEQIYPVPTSDELSIADGSIEEFYCKKTIVGTLTYTRTLPNLVWNALYVPFEIPMSELENYDVAYINDVHSYDNNEDGEIDDLKMEVIKITTGTLKANYPYLIRAKNDEAKEMSIVLTDATLYATKENKVSCSSVFMKFDVTGTYSQMSSEDLNGSLVITSDGSWKQLAENSVLRPFRLYLTMTDIDGSPVKVSEQAVRSMRIVARGESEGTTSIDNAQWTTEDETVVYDLQGRRVAQPTKGMYIVNGRKVVIK